MTWRGDLTRTSNGQYGQWFDATRRLTSPYVARYVNVTPSPLRPHQHSASAISRSHTSRDQLLSRDQIAVTSSRDDSASDSRQVPWRPATLPLSLQRSSTTFGRLSTSVSGAESVPPSESHAELIRDYRRYRQIQAGISTDEPWRGTGRLLTRPTSVVTAASSGDGEDRRPTDTTVVPLQLRVAGPKPLQRSVADVVCSRRPAADRAVSSLLTSQPSDTSQLTHSPAQVYF